MVESWEAEEAITAGLFLAAQSELKAAKSDRDHYEQMFNRAFVALENALEIKAKGI